ncbi:60S ribosomal protein L32-like [Ursus americanus]|uniref:60S ribosomal protein L32-like n=1 Tax=Ursus americanus TaxID=9643 RepID=UPI001E67AD6E|nr:60S ribosomal protein L32-like [Ursus americanus]
MAIAAGGLRLVERDRLGFLRQENKASWRKVGPHRPCPASSPPPAAAASWAHSVADRAVRDECESRGVLPAARVVGLSEWLAKNSSAGEEGNAESGVRPENVLDPGQQGVMKQLGESCLVLVRGGSHRLLSLGPLGKPRIGKKRTERFIRDQSDRCVKSNRNWRKPSGIDNRVSRTYTGQILMPSISYGSSEEAKPMLPRGFRKFLVHNIEALAVLPVCNKSHRAETAHSVSSKNHKATVERAARLAIRVANPIATLCSEENE